MSYVSAHMLLYHGLAETGSIEIASNPAGPWTTLTLTSTKKIVDAMAEWQALAEAALPSTWWFGWDDPYAQPYVWFSAASANRYVRISACLAELLGFSLDHPYMVSDYVLDVGLGQQASSDVDALGMFGSDATNRFAIGLTLPVDVESAELSEYRAGRASVLHYGRASEVTVDLFVAPDLWRNTRSSPLLSGHAAFWVSQGESTDFSESLPEGALTLYPLEPISIEQDSPDDHVWIRLRCTRADDAEVADTDLVVISDGEVYDFGERSAAADYTFTVSNVGGSSATGIAARAFGDPAFAWKGGVFPGAGGTLGAALGSGASGTVVVTFTPSSGVESKGQITLAYSYFGVGRSTVRPIRGSGA